MAVDGIPTDWPLVHLGSRAVGGAGLVFVEMTCPSPEARISPGCTGLWNETQRDAFKRIVDFCHAQSGAKLCMQLGHAGRKGSTQLDRKSTRLNSSHSQISYAVFCLKKKKNLDLLTSPAPPALPPETAWKKADRKTLSPPQPASPL